MSTNLHLTVTSPSGVATDLSAWLEAKDQWTVDQNYGRQGDTAVFYLYDEHGYQQLSFIVEPLSTIVFRDEGINATLFAGVVTKPEVQWVGPGLALWILTCTDFTYYADSAIVAANYVDQTADQIMVDLVRLANCGITADLAANGGQVYPAPLVPALQINYLQLSAAFTRVAQYASQSTSFGWWIDESRRLRFYDQLQAPDSGVLVTDDLQKMQIGPTVAHYTADTNTDYVWDGTQLRTRCVVRGASHTFTQTDTWVGDGHQAAWPLTYPTDASGTAVKLTVAGASQVVGLDDGSAAPSDAFIITQTSVGQWFLRVGTATVPAAGDVIVLNYQANVPVIAQADNRAAESQYNGPNGGVFAMYLADTSIPDTLSALQRGQRELQEYGLVEERASFYTTDEFPGHFRTGQLITYHNSTLPDAQGGWRVPLQDRFLVIQNHITGSSEGVGQRVYQVTAVRI